MKLSKIAYLPTPLRVGASTRNVFAERRGRQQYDYYGDLWIHVRRLLFISVLITGVATLYACSVLSTGRVESTSVTKMPLAPTNSTTLDRITPKFELGPSESLAFRQEKEALGRKKPPRPSLHLIGERHCGTNWIYQRLNACFDPKEVSVRNGLSRWKHWFQEEGDYSLFKKRNATSDEEPSPTVVIAQFRNPYDWFEAMRANPYHSPQHFDLDWHDFVTRPWTMERYGKDILSLNQTNDEVEPTCIINKQTWKYHQIIPCLETSAVKIATGRQVHTVYELRRDGSGLPYESILELRADKIRNHLSVANYEGVDEFFAVQYEDNVRSGTAPLIQALEQALDVKAKCDPLPPSEPSSRAILPEYVKWMNEHLDWETEALIGYEPNVF